MTNELPEESDQFRFLHTACLVNLKGSVGLTLTKESVMRISIPLDLSSRPFIQVSRFIRSRFPTPLLDPSLVLFPPRSTSRLSPFFILFQINTVWMVCLSTCTTFPVPHTVSRRSCFSRRHCVILWCKYKPRQWDTLVSLRSSRMEPT